MTGNSGRKAAQRTYPATRCAVCGGIKTLQRHHIDRDPTNNRPDNVQILCQTCHAATHRAAGDWGRGNVAPAVCAVCGAPFQPQRSSRATLCRNPACRIEKGRLSAALRWTSRTA